MTIRDAHADPRGRSVSAGDGKTEVQRENNARKTPGNSRLPWQLVNIATWGNLRIVRRAMSGTIKSVLRGESFHESKRTILAGNATLGKGRNRNPTWEKFCIMHASMGNALLRAQFQARTSSAPDSTNFQRASIGNPFSLGSYIATDQESSTQKADERDESTQR